MRATQTKVYPFYKVEAEPTPPPKRWKWNRTKAYDNLLQVVGMLGVAAWLTYLIIGWIDGKWY